MADSFLAFGDLYSSLDYKIADSFFDRSIEIGRQLNNDTVLYRAFRGKGYHHYFMAAYYQSMQYFLKAEEIVQKFEDASFYTDIENGMGLIYLEVQMYDSARKIFTRIRDQSLRRKDSAVYLSSIGNMGWFYICTGKPDSAVKMLRLFFSLYKYGGVSDAGFAIEGASNLGEAYLMLGNADSAIYCLQKAYSLSSEFSNRTKMFYTSCLLVKAWLLKGDKKAALEAYSHIDTAFLGSNREAGNHSLFYEVWYKLDSALGNTKAALKNHLLYKQWSDSATAQLNTRGISFLLENAKAEKIKLENQQLQLKNELQKRRTRNQRNYFILGALLLAGAGIAFYRNRMHQQRRKSLLLNNEIREAQLKALRSQMNPHFLFNLMAKVEARIETDAVAAQQIVTHFSTLVRRSLEMSEEKFIPLEEEINYLHHYCSLMQQAADNPFAFYIKADEALDTAMTKIPSMLAQPVVENAILHGFGNKKQGGRLEVHFSPAPVGGINCRIADNGPGILHLDQQQRKSFGQSILKNRLALYEQLLGRPFPLEIRNILSTEGHIQGLEVMMLLPVGHE
jgi:tetratricopeptide (TPR) repeat protein